MKEISIDDEDDWSMVKEAKAVPINRTWNRKDRK
jgi:hypothetical protein